MGDFFAAIARVVINAALALGSLVASAVPSAAPAHPPAPVVAAADTPAVAHSHVSSAVPARLLVRYRSGVANDVAEYLEKASGARKTGEIQQVRVRVLQVHATKKVDASKRGQTLEQSTFCSFTQKFRSTVFDGFLKCPTKCWLPG